MQPANDAEPRTTGDREPPADRGGSVLDLMVFNIWHGGRLDGHEPPAVQDQNLDELIDYLAHERPDLIFLIETYGAGQRIEAALNRDQQDGRVFRGIPITREPGQADGRDNLWLFTWLEVHEVYPVISEDPVTSFHFGGARLGLPAGGHIHAFTTWISHLANSWSPLTQTVMETDLGIERSFTEAEIVATDHERRLDMARTILSKRLPRYVHDDAPVVLGGDFNTQSHLDWTAAVADAPRHAGLVLPWPVMRMFADAGFTDMFRAAHPDATRVPGRTWTAGNSFMYAPLRLDYLLVRGKDVDVLAASTRTRRLPEHRGTDLDALYPFYSDHGAVVCRLRFPGDGDGYAPASPAVDEPVLPGWPELPEAPPGTPVPADVMTASASSSEAGHDAAIVLDGDPRTHWGSRTSSEPRDPLPQHLTLDLGGPRTLTAVRYRPRIDSFEGIATRYTYQVSDDGVAFSPVQSGTWDRDALPKDVGLPDVKARYLRLLVEVGASGCASASELIPYE